MGGVRPGPGRPAECSPQRQVGAGPSLVPASCVAVGPPPVWALAWWVGELCVRGCCGRARGSEPQAGPSPGGVPAPLESCPKSAPLPDEHSPAEPGEGGNVMASVDDAVAPSQEWPEQKVFQEGPKGSIDPRHLPVSVKPSPGVFFQDQKRGSQCPLVETEVTDVRGGVPAPPFLSRDSAHPFPCLKNVSVPALWRGRRNEGETARTVAVTKLGLSKAGKIGLVLSKYQLLFLCLCCPWENPHSSGGTVGPGKSSSGALPCPAGRWTLPSGAVRNCPA